MIKSMSGALFRDGLLLTALHLLSGFAAGTGTAQRYRYSAG